MKMIIILTVLGVIFLAAVCYDIFNYYKPRIKAYFLYKVYSIQAHKELYDIKHKQRVVAIKKRDNPTIIEEAPSHSWRVNYRNGKFETICTDLEVIE